MLKNLQKNDFILVMNTCFISRQLNYDSIIQGIVNYTWDLMEKRQPFRKEEIENLMSRITELKIIDKQHIRINFNEYHILKAAALTIQDSIQRRSWQDILCNTVLVTNHFRRAGLMEN